MAMEKIEYCNDLLMAILVNLPPKSIFKFMCVSNRWNNIINDPLFLQSYSIATKRKHHQRRFSSNRLLAFIELKHLGPYYSAKLQQYPLKISPIINNGYKFEVPIVSLDYFINCSDGLVLCGHNWDVATHYYVLNPIRGTIVSLPPVPPREKRDYIRSMGLVCEEFYTNELVPNFRVVCAVMNDVFTHTLSIQTYSSKTREWTSSPTTLIATGMFELHDLRPPVVCNGIFHWFSRSKTLAVYDSNDGCDNHVQLIIMPYSQKYSLDVTRSSSDDVLWFVMNHGEDKNCLEFWMLPKDDQRGGGSYKRSTTIPKSEWILMHTVSHDSLRQKITFSTSRDWVHLEWLIRGKPLVAVLKVGNVLCFYNLETDSVELVRHGDRCGAKLYPYMEPLFLSSYAI